MDLPSPSNQDFVVRFWKHDREDAEQDANLLDFLGTKEEKKEAQRRSKSKTIAPKQDTSLHENVKIEDYYNNNNYDPSPRKLTQVKSEGRFQSIKKHRNTAKNSQNDLDMYEEPMSPLIPINSKVGLITPEPTRGLEGKYIPVINPHPIDAKVQRHHAKKPSFNVGIQQYNIEGSIEMNNSIKIADLLSDKQRMLNRKSTLPTISTMSNTNHTRTQSYNQGLIPLNQFADQDFNEIPEVLGNNRGGSKSPMKGSGVFQTPNPGRASELVSAKLWNEVGNGNNKGNNSPDHLLRPYQLQNDRVVGENLAFSYPTGQTNPPFFAGSDNVMKALIKLPRLNNRNVPSDSSPFGSPLRNIFDKSPGLKPNRDREYDASPNQFDRRVARFGSIAHNPSAENNSVFKMAAVRQLGEYL